MAEYIEREALIDDIEAAMDNGGMGYSIGQTLKRYVKRQPSADVAPVVRCKDCIFSRKLYGKLECINGISYRNTWNKPEMFCSYGEKR